MNIWLCDFDGKFPNLALMRLSAAHKAMGNSVTLVHGPTSRPLWNNPDQVYLSCVFRWNQKDALLTAKQFDGACISGGTGINIHSQLPDFVNGSQPDYSIYPDCDYAVGFISRGCIRNCPWCVVPRKEGKLQRVSTAAEIVGSRTKAVFLDNNFLALPDCADDLDWLAANGILIDFNQGLDARLIDEHLARKLAQCKWYPNIRISLDSDGMIESVHRAIVNLEQAGMNPSTVRVYCLIGFSDFQSDVERLIKLHEWGAAPFPMGYRDNDTGEQPARGWDRTLYNKYRRLICRMPMAKSVWEDFRRDLL